MSAKWFVIATLLVLLSAAHAKTYVCATSDGRHFAGVTPLLECKDVEIRVLNPDGSVKQIIPPEPMWGQESLGASIVRDELQQALAKTHMLIMELDLERKRLEEEATLYEHRQVPQDLRQAGSQQDIATAAREVLRRRPSDPYKDAASPKTPGGIATRQGELCLMGSATDGIPFCQDLAEGIDAATRVARIQAAVEGKALLAAARQAESAKAEAEKRRLEQLNSAPDIRQAPSAHRYQSSVSRVNAIDAYQRLPMSP